MHAPFQPKERETRFSYPSFCHILDLYHALIALGGNTLRHADRGIRNQP